MPDVAVRAFLLVACPDQRGIVAALSDFIHRHGGVLVYGNRTVVFE